MAETTGEGGAGAHPIGGTGRAITMAGRGDRLSTSRETSGSMNITTVASLAAAAMVGVIPAAAGAQHGGHDHGSADAEHTEHGSSGRRTIEMTVTSDGFAPAEIVVRRGETVKLVITRKTERTCAKEIVVKDLGISRSLPLNEPVAVELTPRKSGKLRYACGMDMISGVVVVD